MFQTVPDMNEMFLSFNKRTIKRNKIEPFHSDAYFQYVLNYEGREIIPDIFLLDYQEAITKNRYICQHFADVAKTYWLFATGGQGDEWLIRKSDGYIVFYDHNYSEYDNKGFVFLDIDFFQFMQMALLLASLEQVHEQILTEADFNKFVSTMNGISNQLYEKYPFEIF